MASWINGTGCTPAADSTPAPAVVRQPSEVAPTLSTTANEQVVLPEPLPLGELAQADATPQAAPLSSGKLEQETWDVVFFQGAKVGYGRMAVSRLREGDRDLLRIDGLQHLSLKRFGQANEQEIKLTSIETPQGEVIRFEAQTAVGPSPISVRGEVRAGELVVDSTTEGRTTNRKMPWKKGVGGFFALEMSLLRKPLVPGEKRRIEMLAPPLLNQVELATLDLTAREFEPTKLLGGNFQLLRVDSRATLPGNVTLDSVMWTDRLGNLLKSVVPAVRQETFRTTKDVALGEPTDGQVDLGFDTMVRVEGRSIPRPHDTKRVKYRVTLADGDPASIFSSGSTQTVASTGANQAEVMVISLAPNATAGAKGTPRGENQAVPTDDDRKPNGLIQSDDPIIVAMAKEAAGNNTDHWRTAVALEQYVHENIKAKNFSQAFATAAEVAKTLEGDCTEHAVLLAALARARGIPARVVIGLIFVPSAAGFGYHMWTEVFVGGQWVPLDATLGRGGIGAAHLKLTHSSLAEASAYSCFLPVATVLGRLKIEVLEVE
ncbi:MAG: transglutaminase domain-containing protein [Pirellulales bacterium]|nr:transglutaminase domain-containing protein [Pirellulales bacterium]